MARGDMLFTSRQVSMPVNILNRAPKEGVSMTIDFSNVETVDADNGLKVVKAGTPINKDGVPVSATPWAGAVGILYHDVWEDRPQGTILKKAYINTTKAQENSGLTYDGALLTALSSASCRIVLEAPVVVAAAASAGA